MLSLLALGPQTFETKEDWARFVQEPVSRAPKLPAPDAWKVMTADERAQFNGARLRHHSRMIIQTPVMKEIHDDLIRLTWSNLHRPPGARPGAVIDGLGAHGKTTILVEFGRRFERKLREQLDPAEQDDEFIPVCYVSLPAGTSIRSLSAAMAAFYGIDAPGRCTAEQLTQMCKTCARRCRTVLFLIDEVHYLNMRNEGDRKVNNHLKHLANGLAATFVYAGIGLGQRGFLGEGIAGADVALSQTQRRFRHYEIAPFQIGTPEGDREWKSLIMALEREVVLLRQPPASLVTMHRYLFERTGGVIGSVTELVRQAANLAIERKTERITQDLLDEVELDTAAEAEYERRAPAAAARRPRGQRVQRARNERAHRIGAGL
jgi:hypothetical protein